LIRYAVTAIKKKFYHQNPHAALYALQVLYIVCPFFAFALLDPEKNYEIFVAQHSYRYPPSLILKFRVLRKAIY
jgi:hypothetical protein